MSEVDQAVERLRSSLNPLIIQEVKGIPIVVALAADLDTVLNALDRIVDLCNSDPVIELGNATVEAVSVSRLRQVMGISVLSTDRQAELAKAWDQGYLTGWSDHERGRSAPVNSANPYRADG